LLKGSPFKREWWADLGQLWTPTQLLSHCPSSAGQGQKIRRKANANLENPAAS